MLSLISQNLRRLRSCGPMEYWHHLKRHSVIAGSPFFPKSLCKVSNHIYGNIQKECVIVFSNWWEGGSESFIFGLSRRLGTDVSFLILYPTKQKGLIRVEQIEDGQFILDYHICGLDCISTIDPHVKRSIIINQLTLWQYYLGLNSMTSDGIVALVKEIKALKTALHCSLTYMVHDYYAICPRLILLPAKGSYCRSEFSTSKCQECLSCSSAETAELFAPGISIAGWRNAWRKLFAISDEIRTFSQDSFTRMSIILNDAPITLKPHKPLRNFKPITDALDFEELHIGVFGNIGRAKGFDVVRDLAALLESQQKIKAKLTICGTIPGMEDAHSFNVTGRYNPEELPQIILTNKINIALFPSIWPETFSYVTQELMSLGIPIVAFNMGAPAERIKCYKYGSVIDTEDPSAVLTTLQALFCKMRTINQNSTLNTNHETHT